MGIWGGLVDVCFSHIWRGLANRCGKAQGHEGRSDEKVFELHVD